MTVVGALLVTVAEVGLVPVSHPVVDVELPLPSPSKKPRAKLPAARLVPPILPDELLFSVDLGSDAVETVDPVDANGSRGWSEVGSHACLTRGSLGGGVGRGVLRLPGDAGCVHTPSLVAQFLTRSSHEEL